MLKMKKVEKSDGEIIVKFKSKDEIEEDSTDEGEEMPRQKLTPNGGGVKLIEGTLQYLQEPGAPAMVILFLQVP